MQDDGWDMPIGSCSAVAVSPIAMAPPMMRARTVLAVVEAQRLVFHGVDVSSTSGGKEHLNAHDDEHRRHGDEAGGSRVPFVPEARKTWVGEGFEGGGQEVDKRGCYEDACAEVSG